MYNPGVMKRYKTRAQTRRQMAERRANARAAKAGKPLPFPNIWDTWDPTKVPADATPEEIHRSYLEFTKICRPRPRKRYIL